MKRGLEEFHSDRLHYDVSMPDPKKSARCLPIRPLPEHRFASGLNGLNQSYANSFSQIPTPIEPSEDDTWEFEEPGLACPVGHPLDHSHPGVDIPTYTSAIHSLEQDDHMDFVESQPSLPHLSLLSSASYQGSNSRHRSMLHCNPTIAISRTTYTQDRTPTPVTRTFGKDAHASMSSHGRLPHLRTNLSPLIGADSPHTGLPSPAADRDDYQMQMSPVLPAEATMQIPTRQHNHHHHQQNAFQASAWEKPLSRSLDDHLQRESASHRTARLQMGFRADCEKCRQHVPGHYSHILWT